MLPTVQKRIPSVAIFISLSSQPHFNTHNNTHNNDEDKGGILKWFLSKKTISKTWMFFRIQILFLSPDIQKLRLKSWTNVKKERRFLTWQESADSVTSSTRLKFFHMAYTFYDTFCQISFVCRRSAPYFWKVWMTMR